MDIFDSYYLNPLTYTMLFFWCLNLTVVLSSLRRSDSALYRSFSFYTLLIFGHTSAYVMQTAAQTLELKLFWANIKVTFLCFLPVAWLWVTFLITNKKPLNKIVNTLLVIVALMNTLVIWNDAKLHIFRETVSLYHLTDNIVILKATFGMWFMTIYVWSLYIPTIVSILIFASAFMNSGKAGKMQYGLLALTILVSVLTGILQTTSVTHLDTFAMSVGITSVMYFILINNYQMFGIIPLSGNAILDLAESGIIVFDVDGKIVEKNKYANSILSGNNINDDFDGICSVFSLKNAVSLSEPIEKVSGDIGGRIYTSKLIPLKNRREKPDGYVVIINDTTEYHKLLQIQKEQDMLEQKNVIISDIHDNISGNVSVIGLLASSAIDEDEHQRVNILSKIADLSSDTCREVRFMMNSYERHKFTIKDMIGEMRYNGNSFADGINTKFDFKVSADETIISSDIDFKKYINLIRFFKEAIVNSIKHSGSDIITAEISVAENIIHLTISDKGRGLEEKKGIGRGMSNMRKRISVINGEMEIISGNGTTLKCHVPLD